MTLQILCVMLKVLWKVKQSSNNPFMLEVWLVKDEEIKLCVFNQEVPIAIFFYQLVTLILLDTLFCSM